MKQLIIKFCSILITSIFLSFFAQNLAIAQVTDDSLTRTEQSENLDLGKHFRDLNVEGSIIIYDLKNNQTWQHNPSRNLTAFPTASTFKIMNSLIALETGVIKDEIDVLTWDGIVRDLPQWNRDLNLKEAFQISGVWFYQVLARRIGFERMQQWINQVGYGNQTIGNQENIDQFWLNGILTITPQQQVEFLRRLYLNQLPFSERSLAIVKEIMITEKTPDYTIRAKTGWFGFGNDQITNIGWYVGYLETGDKAYFFATNIQIRNAQDPSYRIEITRRCLKDIGAL
jgi:beta-lactamase class D